MNLQLSNGDEYRTINIFWLWFYYNYYFSENNKMSHRHLLLDLTTCILCTLLNSISGLYMVVYLLYSVNCIMCDIPERPPLSLHLAILINTVSTAKYFGLVQSMDWTGLPDWADQLYYFYTSYYCVYACDNITLLHLITTIPILHVCIPYVANY